MSPDAFAEAFLGGRTLGEANLRRGWNVVSGTLYGDPLYSPLAVRVRFRDPELVLVRGAARYVSTTQPTRNLDFIVNSMNGTAQSSSTEWMLASCKSLSPERCDQESLWTAVRTGVGAARDLAVANLKELVADPARCGSLSLRLEVRTDRPHNFPLRHTVSLKYGPMESEPPSGPQVDAQGNLLGDLNRDGTIDSADLPILLAAWGPGTGRPDLNGDGQVDSSDLVALLSQWGQTLPDPTAPECRFD